MEPIDMALETLRTFLLQAGAFLPRVLLALAIAIAGWLVAKAIRFSIVRALRSINFQILTERAGIDAFLQMGGSKADTTAVLGILVYWLTIIAGLILASNSLGLSYVTDLLARIALFMPRLILAVVILAFGAYFANFIGDSVKLYSRNAGFEKTSLLGRVAHYAVLLFVILIALDQLGGGSDFIRQSFLIILGGIILALAIAFGLGGQRWAANLLEHLWPQREKEEEPHEREN